MFRSLCRHRKLGRLVRFSAHVVVSLLWLTILVCTVSSFSFFVCIITFSCHKFFPAVLFSFPDCSGVFASCLAEVLEETFPRCFVSGSLRFVPDIDHSISQFCEVPIPPRHCFTESLFLGIVLFPASSIAFAMFSESNFASVSFLTFWNSV